ncbi:tripartite motif-containing protein 2-like [Argopecten irradians]|uniref:tripartite motif-containing protein 2-like n=1 Tax=Argopecten irradians TaxID=31199 RepID=UPI00371F3666
MVLTTLAAGTGKPLLCSPWRITECPITSNVAVIDDNKESDGGDGKKHVVVMDTDFQKLFAYRCNIPRAYQQTSQTGQQPFNPNGVVYDSQGNILIADFNNSTVIILSGEGGKVLRILQTDTGRKALAYVWKGATTCLQHKGRQLEFYCEKCQELACSKCVSTTHKGHLLCDISEIADQRTGDIRNFIDRIDQNELVQNRRKIASIGVILRDNDSTFQKLSTQVKKQTEKLKRDLDKLTIETLSLYTKMKEGNTKLIQKYQEDQDLYGKHINQQMQACKTVLQQGSSLESMTFKLEIADQRTRYIRDFIDRTEQNELVQVHSYIVGAETLLKDNDSTFDQICNQLKTQTENLKKQLDNLLTETLSLYHKMKEDNAKLIQTYKQELKLYDEELKQQMRECKTILQQGSSLEIYDTECEIDPRLHLPMKPGLGTACFNPNENPQNHLQNAFGKVIAIDQIHTSFDQEKSVKSPDDQQQPSTQQQSKRSGEKLVTVNTLLTETKVLEVWSSPCDISSICPITDDQAWTNDITSNTITLLDRKGAVKQKIMHEVWISGISFSPTTQRLWVCDNEQNILELESGQLTKRFSTKEQPRSICVTKTNHIIACMSNHITKYTTQGQIVLTTTMTGTVERMYQKITECPITHNVAVSCCNKYVGGDTNRVVVMDTNFQELFVYRGEISSTYKQTPPTGGRPFTPWDIVYDSQGNIIIANRDNMLLLLTGEGKLLRILHTDTVWTSAVGIDREDVLWSVCGSDFTGYNVNILQYSSKT